MELEAITLINRYNFSNLLSVYQEPSAPKVAKINDPDQAPYRPDPDHLRDRDRHGVGCDVVGDAWKARTTGDNPKYYLRVRLDDPSLSEPFTAALFPSEEGDRAQLVWNRRRE